ncbi:endonuclease domain-containing protein [Streptomyces tendae]|uniref:endonuclease domain-containing protein n=1 Tax=Streptomyces tendae TaxID=1932 RepID=UPI0033CF879D
MGGVRRLQQPGPAPAERRRHPAPPAAGLERRDLAPAPGLRRATGPLGAAGGRAGRPGPRVPLRSAGAVLGRLEEEHPHGVCHRVPAVCRGVRPAVHRPPAGCALRRSRSARHRGRRLSVPPVPAEPGCGGDHCHEHGCIRGPLCGSCNTREGTGFPCCFLRLEGAALHLLECRGWLERGTLPGRFHTAVVRACLGQAERQGRCPRESYVRELEHAHGVRRFELGCSGWHASRWTKDVAAPETAALVQAFVDASLAAPEGVPSPGPAAG